VTRPDFETVTARIQIRKFTDCARCVRLNFFLSVYPLSYQLLNSIFFQFAIEKFKTSSLRSRKVLNNLHTYSQHLCVKCSIKPSFLPIQIAYRVMAPSHWVTPRSKPPPLSPLTDLSIGLHPFPASSSCLSDRKFRAKMEGKFSDRKPLRADVPQGAVLVP
jgi:hypothetical protein